LSFALQKLLRLKRAVFGTMPKSDQESPSNDERCSWIGANHHMMIPANPFKQTSHGQSRAESADIWRARQFIEQHCGEEISLTKLAKAVNSSANHLSEKFKQVTGVNFVDYVARTRFEKASDLLLNSNRRISEIAFAAGFQSLSQFNRVFKKLAGKSPTDYRAAPTKRRRRR
jgi:AraC-like DNA-binding protein